MLSELIQVRLPAEPGGEHVRFYHRQTGQLFPLDGLHIDSDRPVRYLASAFSEGLAVARRSYGGKKGYVNVTGDIVIPFRFVAAEPFCEGRARAAVSINSDGTIRWGLINTSGQWVVRPGRYDGLGQFREGRCAFRKGKLWGLLDATGEPVVPPRYMRQPRFHLHLADVTTKGGEHVYIDPDGRVQFTPPANAVAIHGFTGGSGVAWFAVAVQGEAPDAFEPADETWQEWRYGLLSVTGKVVTRAVYSGAGEFSEGLAAVSKDASHASCNDKEPMTLRWEDDEEGTWGYIDGTGEVVIAFRFDQAGRFSDGLARVRQNGKWGYIDKSGDLVIACTFSWARDFRGGLAEVWHEGVIQLIDRTGRVVLKTDLPAETF